MRYGNYKLKNPSTQRQSPAENWRVEKKNHSFLARWHDLSSQLSAFPELDAVLSVYLCLSSSVPLVSLVPLRPPSNFFIHSPSLPLPTRSIQYTSPKRRSLAECGCSLTLPTHYLNRHMAWCGCHEILTQRSIADLFLTNFFFVTDSTMLLVVEPLESFVSTYWYSAQCASLWSTKKPSVLQSGTIHFDCELKTGSHSETYLLLSFEQSACIYSIDCFENTCISEVESARCSGNIEEESL